MEQLQKFFERLAGVTHEEKRRLAFARQLFGASGIDFEAMEVPACWRRRNRISF